MDRRERINRDRAAMAKKALVEAGYLRADEDDKAADYSGIASGFLADLMHLAVFNGHRVDLEFATKAAMNAWEAHKSDAPAVFFGER